MGRSRWPGFSRSAGVVCLLLWGLALPRPVAGEASERSVVVGSARHPALRVSAVEPLDRMDSRLLRQLELREESRRMVHEWMGPHGISAKGLARAQDRKDAIAFGPYLIAGTYVALAWGATIAEWYLGSG